MESGKEKVKVAVSKKADSVVYVCGFCSKEYKRESTLATHKCVVRERYLEKGTKIGLLGFDMWLKFRSFYRIPLKKAEPEYEQYIKSSEYTSFRNLAVYLSETPVLKMEDFVMYLFKEGIPERDWCTQKVRSMWTQCELKREHPLTGVSRSIVTLQDWSNDTGNDWTDFFRSVSFTRLAMLLDSGKLSPWFIHASSTRQCLLDRLADDEFSWLYSYIDPSIWNIKKMQYAEDYNRICNTLREYGI